MYILFEINKISNETQEENEKHIMDLSNLEYALDVTNIITRTNVKGDIIYVNDKFCEVSGYAREELIGQNHRILRSGYHSDEFFKSMWKTIANGKVWRGEVKNKTKSGAYYWVDNHIVPILNEAGKPIEYLAIRTEITDRKEKERRNTIFSIVIETSQDPILVIDESGYIIHTN